MTNDRSKKTFPTHLTHPTQLNKETIFIVFGIIFIAFPIGLNYNAGGWFKMIDIVNSKMMLVSNKLNALIRDVNIKLNRIKGG
jgi:hypothetical protein